jgi:hypothetical protein
LIAQMSTEEKTAGQAMAQRWRGRSGPSFATINPLPV